MRILPVLVAAAVYWILGALWYSALFGGIWSRGLEKQGVKLAEPSGKQLAVKLVTTFAATFVAASAMGWLVSRAGISGLHPGLAFGFAIGCGASAVALAIAYTWESKPVSSYLVDASYHLVGITAAAGILAAWR
jgi:hypothetical protein